MKKNLRFYLLWLLFCAVQPLCAQSDSLSVAFLKNKGQVQDPHGGTQSEVLYEVRNTGTKVFLTKNGLCYYFLKPVGNEAIASSSPNYSDFEFCRADVLLVGANIDPANIYEEHDEASPVFRYYKEQASYELKSSSKVIIKDIYPNIDWVFYTNRLLPNGFKHDFVVHQGGDYKQIKMQLKAPGAEIIKEDQTFGLQTKLGGFTDKAPVAYSGSTELSVGIVEENGFLSYNIPNASTQHQDLIIDPINLAWSSFLGGSSDEESCSIYSNGSYVWVGGMSKSVDFPVSSLAGAHYSGILQGSQDAFIAQFDVLGKARWITYYGGSASELVQSLSFDGSRLWATGWTNSSDFPTQSRAGAYNQSTHGGGKDAFVLSFDLNGVRQWATYYGGTADENGQGIQQNGAGIWLSGSTNGNGTPTQTLAGAYNQMGFAGGLSDAFLVKFDVASGMRQWASYYGGPSNDVCKSMSADINSVWLTGFTQSTSFPVQSLAGAYNQPILMGMQDAYILKFNNAGVRQWATYYGGSDAEAGNGICSDGAHVWLGGFTNSTNFPTQNPGGSAFFQAAPMSGGSLKEGIILKFNVGGVRQWATHYGGSGNDEVLSVSKLGSFVWFGGIANSTNLPLQSLTCSYFRGFFEGAQDAFFLRFGSASNVRDWASFYGGTGSETSTTVCADPSYLWATGASNGATFPIQASAAPGAYNQAANSGSKDAYVSKFAYAGGSGATFAALPPLCTVGASIDLNLYVTPSGGTFSGIGVTGGHFFNPSITGAGSFPIIYTYAGGSCSESVTQVAHVSPSPTVTGGVLTVCSNATATDLSPYASPAGGTFFGPGVYDGHWFNATVVGPTPTSPHLILYTYTDPATGCSATANISVFVMPSPEAALDSLPSTCLMAAPFSLSPYASPAGGVFIGPGVSGSTFSPSVAGLGTHTIKYAIGGTSCPDTASRSITITSMTVVSMVGTVPNLCVGAPPLDLSAYVHPAGGTFSGSGVSGTMFNPTTAGSFPVFYNFSGSSCVGGVLTMLIHVAPAPSVSGGVLTVCANGNPVDLRPYGTPAGGVFAGLGVTGHFLDPSSAGPTTPRTLTYTYTNAAGCSATANVLVYIIPSPDAVFNPVPPVCLEATAFSLTSYVTPPGGIFSGAGVSGSLFNPTTAGLGVHTIRYVTSSGCPDTVYQTITVGTGVAITTTPPPTLCANSAALNLNSFVSPVGGVFSGVGVSGSTFNPLISGVGVFTLTYTYTSPTDCTGTATLTVEVKPAPSISVTAPMPLRICQNAASISLLPYVSPNTGTFIGGGVSGLVGSDFDPQLVTPGVYTLLYQYTDCVTGCIASAPIIVQVLPTPSVSMAALPRMCSFNPPLNLSTYATPAGGTFSGVGMSGTDFNPAVAGSGIHPITYTYTDPLTGCSKSVRRNITVGASGGGTFTTMPDVCISAPPVDLSLYTSIDGGTFFGSGVTGSTFYPSLAGLGTHTISYVHGSPAAACLVGCGDTLRAMITVKPVPPMPWVSGVSFVCLSNMGTFVAGGSGSGVTYEWYNAPSGGTLLGTGPVLVLPMITPGVHILWVQATLNGCSSPRAAFCYVVRPCTNPYKVSVSSKGSTDTGVMLAAESSNTTKQVYLWLCDGDTLKTQSKAFLEATKSGFYQVVALSSNGEMSVSDAFEVVIADSDVNTQRNRLVIYPNPNQGVFKIDYQRADLSGKMDLAVVDMNGREVYTQRLEAVDGQVSTAVSISFLPSGSYSVRLSGQHVWAVEQFVKE